MELTKSEKGLEKLMLLELEHTLDKLESINIAIERIELNNRANNLELKELKEKQKAINSIIEMYERDV